MLVAQVFIQVISELFLERRNGKMSSIFMFQLKMMYTSQTEDILFKNYASLSVVNISFVFKKLKSRN